MSNENAKENLGGLRLADAATDAYVKICGDIIGEPNAPEISVATVQWIVTQTMRHPLLAEAVPLLGGDRAVEAGVAWLEANNLARAVRALLAAEPEAVPIGRAALAEYVEVWTDYRLARIGNEA